jgi:hypothetical protein
VTTADASRIVWFLGLQQILHFPRFSLAPSIVSRPGRRLAAYTSDTAPSGGSEFRPGPTAASGTRHFRQDAFAKRNPSIGPSRGAEATMFRRSVTEAMTPRLSNIASRQARLKLTPIAVRGGTFETHIGVRPAADGERLGPQKRHLPIVSFVHASSGSRKSTALAPSLSRSDVQHFPEPERDQPQRRTVAGADDVFRRQRRLFANEQPQSTQRVAGDQTPWFPDREATAASEPQRRKSGVSTIHIDGSALGRWTVQHLERALSKPTTGMTGVDPRAAVPRSRVAPF